jgi:UDP-N-acetylmuramate dehydrogenase
MQENYPLGPLTTLRIGGPARYFARIESESDLIQAVVFSRTEGFPLYILGGGSNLLVGDRGIDGVVLQIAITGAPVVVKTAGSMTFRVPAGNDWDGFVLDVCKRGLAGVECLAGIPGWVGGTPVQNVGAYGQEVSETIVYVRALDLTSMEFVRLNSRDCGFAYRHSIFNSGIAWGRYIVTSVTYRFDPKRAVTLDYADLARHFEGKSPTPLDVYHAVRGTRQRKGMLLVEDDPDCRSAGSFFKNPIVPEAVLTRLTQASALSAAEVPHWPAGPGQVKLAAAWLVERAGFHKGFAMGEAAISSRHTLALTNRGSATAAEIIALRDAIRQRVAELFGIELEQEPVYFGS